MVTCFGCEPSPPRATTGHGYFEAIQERTPSICQYVTWREFYCQRQRADRIFSFHNQLDRLVEDCRGLLDPHEANWWRDRWDAYRREQLVLFGAILEQVEELDVEMCTCLLFELTRRQDAYKLISVESIQSTCSKLQTMPGVYLPDWFIPYYEVQFNEYESFSLGGCGSVHHGQWMGSRAVIKKVFTNDDAEFAKEVEIWSRLYHPHVLQLFGACHVGQVFIVSEFAALGQLDHYLAKLKKEPIKRMRETWRTLYEIELGLLYLHARDVIHCDLKCNNFLIGQDGKAKVSDYGLSRTQQYQEGGKEVVSEKCNQAEVCSSSVSNVVAAARWKAPEILNGAEPTPESDVYSFGMCVVEAVTGEYPWGNVILDDIISDHVRDGGELFSKPHGFSEEQWALVVGACRFNPQERTQLSDIVAKLREFASESATIEELVEPESEVGNATAETTEASTGKQPEIDEDDQFAPPVNNANVKRSYDDDNL